MSCSNSFIREILVPETLLGTGESKAISPFLLPVQLKSHIALGVNVMEHGFFVVVQPPHGPDHIR